MGEVHQGTSFLSSVQFFLLPQSELWDGNVGIVKAPVCSWLQGDGCQLEHVQGYNDLIKELCKFYVQGFCSKGNDCPYMHNILFICAVPVAVVSTDVSVMSCFLHSALQSFPCKYFHRNGLCSQGDACRFSHEPLNDVTTKLLDEVRGPNPNPASSRSLELLKLVLITLISSV